VALRREPAALHLDGVDLAGVGKACELAGGGAGSEERQGEGGEGGPHVRCEVEVSAIDRFAVRSRPGEGDKATSLWHDEVVTRIQGADPV